MSYKVYECRRSAGLSQTELSRMAGVDQKTISNYENGGDMKVSAAVKIAKALGVTLYKLLGMEDPLEKRQMSLFPDDAQMVDYWERLNNVGKARLLDYARMLALVPENVSSKSSRLHRAAL